MAAIMLQIIPSFYAKISEKVSLFLQKTFEKYIVCKDYCIAHHDDKTFSSPVCKYHILLLGEDEELRHKLDTFCFTYQHVDGLYTLYKYRFYGKIIATCTKLIENVQRAISFNQRKKRCGQNAKNCEKEALESKV